MLDTILDQHQSPVARMRLLSDGIQQNNRLEKGSVLLGDAGCLACGNCVDNCPVVGEKYRFVILQNQRTSMSLETLVGEECRRCYRCINACPQVGKSIKEYALSFRRGEKIVHLITAATIVLLAGSGISLSHWADSLPAMEVGILRWAHRLLGIILVSMPVLYWAIDKKHMVELIKNMIHWDDKDKRWTRDMMRHLADSSRNKIPSMYQYNSAQKLWGCYLIFVMLPVMTVTGLAQWYYLMYVPGNVNIIGFFTLVHMSVALMTDLLLFLHIYFKYVRGFLRTSYELAVCFLKHRHFMCSTIFKA